MWTVVRILQSSLLNNPMLKISCRIDLSSRK